MPVVTFVEGIDTAVVGVARVDVLETEVGAAWDTPTKNRAMNEVVNNILINIKLLTRLMILLMTVKVTANGWFIYTS